jgi:GDP-4-dehydro-6-deoxy-D-mannose reductase
MRVLITGVSGFVGGHVARRLAERGDPVLGFGVQAAPAGLALADYRVADLTALAEVEAALVALKPDAVVNLAGQASAAKSFDDPSETFRVNTSGALVLLEAVRRAAPKARILQVGSGESYGPLEPGSRASEATPFRPVSPYALSKAAADTAGAAYAEAHGLDLVRTRSFAHTGPGQDGRFVVPSFAQQIALLERTAEKGVLRVGNLEVTRDISDVRDVAAAYVALLDRGARGAAYNVCRGQGVRLADVASRLCALARVPVRIEVDPARVRPVDVPYLVGDPSEIARATGWHAAILFEQTLRDTLEDWRKRHASEPPAASS